MKMWSTPISKEIPGSEKRLWFKFVFGLTVVLAGYLSGALSPVLSAECIESISLEGVHKFSPGDNPMWASPSFDDDNWANVRVPGDLSDQGVHGERGMGWYRIHFTLEDSLEYGEPALALGNVGNADEVYLNGVKIGGEGRIGDGFVEAPWKERLYRIPAGLLHYGEENLLAVRIMNTYRMAGIFEGPVCIGDYSDLIPGNLRLEFLRKGGEIALFTLSFLFLLGSGFLVVQGIRTPEYTSFILFLILYIGLLVLESLFFYDSGMKSPFAQRSIFAISSLLPASGLLFLVCLYRDPMGLWIKTLMAASLLLALLLLTFSFYKAYASLMIAWLVLFGFSGCTLLFLALRAYVRRRHESDPELASEAFASGARAYLLKENAFEELVRAVHTVMDGSIYISPDLSAGTSSAQSSGKSLLLTSRESEILKWIVSGLTNKKIANTLHISVKTVDTHRTSILRKLGVRNTAEMVRHAVKNSLA